MRMAVQPPPAVRETPAFGWVTHPDAPWSRPRQHPGMPFADRRAAGRRLAAEIADLAVAPCTVVALPGGSVPVAVEVATALGAPLELLAVGPITAPGLPHLVLGGVTEDGTGVVNGDMARRLGLSELRVRLLRRETASRLRERGARLRAHRDPLDLHGRTTIVVADALRSGLPALAAVRAARARGAGPVVVATPVAAPDAVALLRTEADDVRCTIVPERLAARTAWYDGPEPSDDDVAPLLAEHAGPGGEDGAHDVLIDAPGARLPGRLMPVRGARGAVVLAARPQDGSRDDELARLLVAAGLTTLTAPLLTPEEAADGAAAFDIPLLTARAAALAGWALADPATRELPLALVGASTSAAAALRIAAATPEIQAVVSCGGRPDLAGGLLADVRAATLLVVGAEDREVLALNRRAEGVLGCPHQLAVVPGAGHRLAGAADVAALARLAGSWLTTHLRVPVLPAH